VHDFLLKFLFCLRIEDIEGKIFLPQWCISIIQDLLYKIYYIFIKNIYLGVIATTAACEATLHYMFSLCIKKQTSVLTINYTPTTKKQTVFPAVLHNIEQDYVSGTSRTTCIPGSR